MKNESDFLKIKKSKYQNINREILRPLLFEWTGKLCDVALPFFC